MAPILLFSFGILVTSFLFALVEIHIEGPHGWAGNLPTWRIENRWTRLLYGKRPLTGYHLYVQLFVLVMAHVIWCLGLTTFTWKGEARVMAFVILFWIMEDFIWFLLNPAFGLRRFTRKHIWWHAPTWWWFMPRDYWVFIPIGLLLYYVSSNH